METIKFLKDKYSKARGGNSEFLSISCAQCGGGILTYQKDGPGDLIRMYIDRIKLPEELAQSLANITEKKELKNLSCNICGNIIGIPMTYEKESRLAYRVVLGSISKTKKKY